MIPIKVYKTFYLFYFISMSDVQIAKEDEIDLLDLINILIRNWKFILTITLIGMISIIIISFLSLKLPPQKSFMPNVYSPKSTVILNNNNNSGGGMESLLKSSGMNSLAGIAGFSLGGSSISDGALAKTLVTKSSFIRQLDNEFNLSDIYNIHRSKHPRTTLRRNISASLKLEIDSDTGLLEISYTHIDRDLATNIVNKITDLLEIEFSKIDLIRNKNQFALAEENKLKVEQEIKRLSLNLITFQKKHNLIDVKIVFEKLMEQMSTMQSSLLVKEVEIQSYGFVSNINDPGYKKLVYEKNAILNAIEKLESGEVGNYPPIKDLPELSLELGNLMSEIDIQKAVYKTIIQQYETLKLTAGGTGPTFQVLEKADIPEIKSGPSRGKLCVIVTFSGFFFSIFFVFIKEVFINIKNDPEKMKRLRGEK